MPRRAKRVLPKRWQGNCGWSRCCVSGWGALHDRFGRLPFKECLAPAIEYARNGYAVVPAFLTPDEVSELVQDLAPIFAMTGNRDTKGNHRYGGVQTLHVHNLLGKTRAVDELRCPTAQ